MSLKKVEQVKKDRWFTLFDLIIYGVVIVLAAVMFIVVYTAFDREELSGVKIFIAAESVFEYEFGKEYICSDAVEVNEDESGLTVTIRTDDGYNVIYIDKSKKSVKMQDADCNGRQCLYFPLMDKNSKFIYCNPHRLRIEPLFRDLDSPDIII